MKLVMSVIGATQTTGHIKQLFGTKDYFTIHVIYIKTGHWPSG